MILNINSTRGHTGSLLVFTNRASPSLNYEGSCSSVHSKIVVRVLSLMPLKLYIPLPCQAIGDVISPKIKSLHHIDAHNILCDCN